MCTRWDFTGRDRHRQGARDLAVRAALGEEREHLALAQRQHDAVGGLAAVTQAEPAGERGQQCGHDDLFALLHPVDDGGELLGAAVAQRDAVDPERDEQADVALHRPGDEADDEAPPPEPLHHVDERQVGRRPDHDEVRVLHGDEAHQFPAGMGFGDNFGAEWFQDGSHTEADERHLVDDDRSPALDGLDHSRASQAAGNVARTPIRSRGPGRTVTLRAHQLQPWG